MYKINPVNVPCLISEELHRILMIILFFNLSIRSTGKPVLLDSTKEEEMRSKLEERFQQYYEFREKVLSLREEDRVARNTAKEKQIQQYEEMQVCLSLSFYISSLSLNK